MVWVASLDKNSDGPNMEDQVEVPDRSAADDGEYYAC